MGDPSDLESGTVGYAYFKIEHRSEKVLSSEFRSEEIEAVICLDLLTLRRREAYQSSYLFADSSFLVIVLCHHPLELQLEHFLL